MAAAYSRSCVPKRNASQIVIAGKAAIETLPISYLWFTTSVERIAVVCSISIQSKFQRNQFNRNTIFNEA